LRIDLLTAINGVGFAEAWKDRFETRFADVPVNVISRAHLIKNKLSTNRLQDRADVEQLRADKN